jgi:hypothetical protein
MQRNGLGQKASASNTKSGGRIADRFSYFAGTISTHGRDSTATPTMRIVLVADTHGLHRTLEVPDGDLLIHAGDFTFYSKPPSIVSDFNAWLGTLPHLHKIIIPGNHEFSLEDPRQRSAITNATLLVELREAVFQARPRGSTSTCSVTSTPGTARCGRQIYCS